MISKLASLADVGKGMNLVNPASSTIHPKSLSKFCSVAPNDHYSNPIRSPQE